MVCMNEPLNSQPGYINIWEFIVSKSLVLEFEKCYGPNGRWADLFGNSAGNLKTELIRDQSNPLRYLTVE